MVTDKQLKNLEKGKKYRFSSTNQPDNAGRKPSIFAKLKKSNLSKEDIINLFKIVIEKSPQEMKKEFEKVRTEKGMEKTDDKPMLYYNIITAILNDLKKGNLNNISSVLNRIIGYPKQEVGVSGAILNVNGIDVEFTKEEEEAFKKRTLESAGIEMINNDKK